MGPTPHDPDKLYFESQVVDDEIKYRWVLKTTKYNGALTIMSCPYKYADLDAAIDGSVMFFGDQLYDGRIEVTDLKIHVKILEKRG